MGFGNKKRGRMLGSVGGGAMMFNATRSEAMVRKRKSGPLGAIKHGVGKAGRRRRRILEM